MFWSYDEQSETLTISGTGRVDDYFPAFMSLKEVPWKHVRNHIKRIVVESGVTYIGKYSTKDMKKLQEVILADTVIELTDEQFAKCAKLEKVKLSQKLNYNWIFCVFRLHCAEGDQSAGQREVRRRICIQRLHIFGVSQIVEQHGRNLARYIL